MNEPPPELIALFERMAKAEPMDLALNQLRAFYLVSTIQFALRHPHFPASIRREMERLGRRLTRALDTEQPGVAVFLDLGWDRSFDVPIEDA